MSDDLDALAARAADCLLAPRPVAKSAGDPAAAPPRPEPGLVCHKRVVRDAANRISDVIETWSRVGDLPPVLRSTARKSFGEPLDRETLRDALGREPTEGEVRKSAIAVTAADLRVPLTDDELAALERT